MRDKERQKALKKKCRKLRTRMTTRGKEYMAKFSLDVPKDTPNKSRLNKTIQQINKLTSNQGSGPWPSSDLSQLDKSLLELQRIFKMENKTDQTAFCALEGFSKLNSVLEVIVNCGENEPCIIPARSLGYCGQTLLAACQGNPDNCRHLLNSNMVGVFIDYLVKRLDELVAQINNNNNLSSLPSDSAAVSIFEVSFLITFIFRLLKVIYLYFLFRGYWILIIFFVSGLCRSNEGAGRIGFKPVIQL